MWQDLYLYKIPREALLFIIILFSFIAIVEERRKAMASFHRRFLLVAFLALLPFLALCTHETETETEGEFESETEFGPDGSYKSSGGFLMSVFKDGVSGLHRVTLTKRTPLVGLPLAVDLSGPLLWVNCEKGYTSSTYFAPKCRSSICSRYQAQSCYTCESEIRPGCHQDTCALTGYNPITGEQASCELGQDVLILQSIRSIRKARLQQFLFGCAPSTLIGKGFPESIEGIAGFGHTPIAIPRQLATHFGFHPTFSVCLPSLGSAAGAIFFGKSASALHKFHLPRLAYRTPLILGSQGQYFIGVKSIRVASKSVSFKTKSVQALISTAHPYTVLESSIYKQVTEQFVSQTTSLSIVQAVAPFGTCFSALGAGFQVPSIDLLLHKEEAVWSILGANSIVTVQPGVQCLGIIDGGVSPTASIILGAYQLENILLQFDLHSETLSYSSPLVAEGTSCSSLHAALASP